MLGDVVWVTGEEGVLGRLVRVARGGRGGGRGVLWVLGLRMGGERGVGGGRSLWLFKRCVIVAGW